MWPRIGELVLGIWLLASPAVLPGMAFGRNWSLALGVAVVTLSLASFTRRFRFAHVITLLIGLGMIVLPMTRPYPVSKVMESVAIVGWLLAMFAVIPSRSNQPPPDWAAMDDARERSGQA